MQISYSSNLFGQCEEEHAGGTIAFPRYDLGEEFHLIDLMKNHEEMDQSLLGILNMVLQDSLLELEQ